MTDPIADMLTRIRNANTAKHDTVDVPSSKMKLAIAKILLDEGYIKSYELVENGKFNDIRITLKYGASKNEKIISGLQRISKPGLRVYANKEELPKVLGGLGKLDLALEIMRLAKEKGVNLVLATDTVAADAFDNNANTRIVPSMEIPDGWEGLDVGPESIASFTKVIEQSKTILWNGPVGVFEMPKFAVGTKAIADAIVKATANGAFSLIGGGDSVAAINQFDLADKVSYVSTGGGALLEYIEGKELPGITAIRGK